MKKYFFFLCIGWLSPTFPMYRTSLLAQSIYCGRQRNFCMFRKILFGSQPSQPSVIRDILFGPPSSKAPRQKSKPIESLPSNVSRHELKFTPEKTIINENPLINTPRKLPRHGIERVQGHFPPQIINLIKYMKNKEKYERMGAYFPHGLLMVGKPGTGKTLVGKAIAEEIDIPLCYESVSNFENKYQGNSQKNIRKFFEETARQAYWSKRGAAIAFIDEIDCLGARNKVNHDTTRKMIGTLLAEMDGKERDSENCVYVIGAANSTKGIDPALMRPGRFDRIIEIPLPDKKSREKILKFYMQAIRYHKKRVDLDKLVSLTEDYTPAQLRHLVNEAALNAINKGDDFVTMNNFYDTITTIQEREDLKSFDGLN